jgi:hypothetical protein
MHTLPKGLIMSRSDAHQATITWQKSSHSGQQGDCVEVASAGTGILVRDSKDADGPVLSFSLSIWNAFLSDIRTGHLGH